jgi:hypothetical protein
MDKTMPYDVCPEPRHKKIAREGRIDRHSTV